MIRTVSEAARELKVSDWTIAELVRRRKVDCIRVTTTDNTTLGGIRFSEEQFSQLLDLLTVKADTDVRPRRKRRSA